MFCPQCGATLKDGSDVCSACGAVVRKDVAPENPMPAVTLAPAESATVPARAASRWLVKVPAIVIGALVIALMFLPWIDSSAVDAAQSADDSFAVGLELPATVQSTPDMYASWFQTAFQSTNQHAGGQNAVEMLSWVFVYLWMASVAIMAVGLIMSLIGTRICRKIARFSFAFVAVFSLSWIIFVSLSNSMTGLPFNATAWTVATLALSVLGAAVSTRTMDMAASTGKRFAGGFLESPLALGAVAYLVAMLVFTFLPWAAWSGAAIDQSSTSDYLGVTMSAIDGTLNGSLTVPTVGSFAIYLFQLASGTAANVIGVVLDGFGAVPYDLLGVIGQCVSLLFLILWIACIVFLAIAIIGGFRGMQEGHDQMMQGLIATAIVSVAWIVVTFVFDSRFVMRIKDQFGANLDSIPASIIAPSVWVWVVAAMAIAGAIALAAISSRQRAAERLASTGTPSVEDAVADSIDAQQAATNEQ